MNDTVAILRSGYLGILLVAAVVLAFGLFAFVAARKARCPADAASSATLGALAVVVAVFLVVCVALGWAH